EALFPQLRGRDNNSYRRYVSVTFKSDPLEESIYKDLKSDLKSVHALEIALGPPKEADPTPPPERHRRRPQQTLMRVGGLDLSLDRSLGIAGTIKLDFQTLKSPIFRRVPHVAVSFSRLGLTYVAPGGQDPTPDTLLARDVLSSTDADDK